jgi:hypothetical protein
MVQVPLLAILPKRLSRWLVSQCKSKVLVRFYTHPAPCIHLMEAVVGVVDALSSNFNQNPVSGLMGLAWSSLASSGKTPFWQTLASGGSWDSPLFGVQLTRYVQPNIFTMFS